jgi:hypothetical protein
VGAVLQGIACAGFWRVKEGAGGCADQGVHLEQALGSWKVCVVLHCIACVQLLGRSRQVLWLCRSRDEGALQRSRVKARCVCGIVG